MSILILGMQIVLLHSETLQSACPNIVKLNVTYTASLSKFDNMLTFVFAFFLSSMFSYEYNE